MNCEGLHRVGLGPYRAMESYTVCACTMVTMDFGHIYGKNRGLLMAYKLLSEVFAGLDAMLY